MMETTQTTTQRRPRLRVSAILEEGERILLVPHYSRGMGDFVWFLPGGDLMHSESLRAATERGVREETGLHVRAMELRGIFEDLQSYRNFHSLCFIYVAKILGGEIKTGADGARPQWFDVHDCPNLRLYPPFSQWDNLIGERYSTQRWDGPERLIGIVLDAQGNILLCRKSEESRTWWPLRLELTEGEQPMQTVARLLARGPQASWSLAADPRLYKMRATVVTLCLNSDAPIPMPETEDCAAYTWTDPALLTTYNMDPAVRRLIYDVLHKLKEPA